MITETFSLLSWWQEKHPTSLKKPKSSRHKMLDNPNQQPHFIDRPLRDFKRGSLFALVVPIVFDYPLIAATQNDKGATEIS